MTRKPILALIVLFALMLNVSGVVAQGGGPSSQTSAQVALGTAFTYQGQLKNGSGFVTGPCDFQFGLWDAPTLGTQSGVTQTLPSVSVTSAVPSRLRKSETGEQRGQASMVSRQTVQAFCDAYKARLRSSMRSSASSTPTDRKIGFCSRFAFSSASGPHGYQSTGL